MAQAAMARIACSKCNASYNSERELTEHDKMAHRNFGSEQSSSRQGGTQPDNSSKIRLGTTKDEWVKLSERLRNHVQARFNPEELDAIDRFILLASQASAFDQVCQ